MTNKIFKPKIDKMMYATWIPTAVLLAAMTVVSAFAPITLLITVPIDIFTFYFLFSSLAGYVELRGESVFIKCGFILKREIPYERIRGFTCERKFYADSMISLKNSLDHVNIKYNTLDLISVSVTDNDGLVREIELRMAAKMGKAKP